MEEIGRYFSKTPHCKKRWSQSKGLEQPYEIPKYRTYSTRWVERLQRNREITEAAYWMKKYKGYQFTDIKEIYNATTGLFYFYIRMRRE